MKPRPIANPPNPWATGALDFLDDPPLARLHVYEDASKSILAKNDSPDLAFRYSVNPYRGCQHACAYCYARPGHEYLDFGAGTDFDTKIVVKRQAAALLKAAFQKPSWRGELVMFSGVTDCYQPLEASLRLTRACLEVCAEYRNPVSIITKSPLVERDLDLLRRLKEEADVRVLISIPIWDEVNARAIEPGVATPRRRVAAIRALAQAGIPVGVMVAPLIPGVSEDGLVELLAAAREAGATTASWVLLRLPGPVKDVFTERLREALPLRADRVLGLVRQTRGGELYTARFFERGRGEGVWAEAVKATFDATTRKLGYSDAPHAPREDTFRRPFVPPPQLSLF